MKSRGFARGQNRFRPFAQPCVSQMTVDDFWQHPKLMHACNDSKDDSFRFGERRLACAESSAQRVERSPDQKGHLELLDPSEILSFGVRRSRPTTGLDHRPILKRAASNQPGRCRSEDRIEPLKVRFDDRRQAFADWVLMRFRQPVTGIPGVRFPPVTNRVPACRKSPFAQIARLLGSFVAGVPEVENLQQTGCDHKPLLSRSIRQGHGPDRFAQKPPKFRQLRLALDQRRSKTLIMFETEYGQCRNGFRTAQPLRFENPLRRVDSLKPLSDRAPFGQTRQSPIRTDMRNSDMSAQRIHRDVVPW